MNLVTRLVLFIIADGTYCSLCQDLTACTKSNSHNSPVHLQNELGGSRGWKWLVVGCEGGEDIYVKVYPAVAIPCHGTGAQSTRRWQLTFGPWLIARSFQHAAALAQRLRSLSLTSHDIVTHSELWNSFRCMLGRSYSATHPHRIAHNHQPIWAFHTTEMCVCVRACVCVCVHTVFLFCSSAHFRLQQRKQAVTN